MTSVDRKASYSGDGNVRGGSAGLRSRYAGTRNSRSRRGDSVALVARERDARASVCVPREVDVKFSHD